MVPANWQLANQSWLLSLSLDVLLSGESADGGGSQMDTRDN